MIVRSTPVSDLNDKTKACVVDVEGVRHEAMVAEAKREAARVLEEPVENLYASQVSSMHVTRRERFAPYLGAARAPTAWRLSVTVKLHPDIVAQRRGRSPAAEYTGPRLVSPESDEEGS